MNRVLGIVFLVVGIVIFAFGVNASFSVTEKVVEGVSGQYTEHTMLYIIGGIALIVGGSALLMVNRSKD